MNIPELVSAHRNRTALQFSGGRDSLALLYLLREFWSDVCVYYCDPGDAFPETLALVAEVEKLVPKFKRVQGFSLASRAKYGNPLDVLPSPAIWLRREDYANQPKYQVREICCYQNIMAPLHAAMVEDGITLILRGVRGDDNPKPALRTGYVEAGITLGLPLEDWTEAQVVAYLTRENVTIPRFYSEGMSGAPDCLTCSAWLETGSFGYVSKHHPEAAGKVHAVLKIATAQLDPMFARMKEIG